MPTFNNVKKKIDDFPITSQRLLPSRLVGRDQIPEIYLAAGAPVQVLIAALIEF